MHGFGRGLNDRPTLCYLLWTWSTNFVRSRALVDTHTWLALTGHVVYAMLSVSIWYSTNAQTFEDHEIDPLFVTADEYDEGLTELRGGDDEALIVLLAIGALWSDSTTSTGRSRPKSWQ